MKYIFLYKYFHIHSLDLNEILQTDNAHKNPIYSELIKHLLPALKTKAIKTPTEIQLYEYYSNNKIK